MRISKCLLVFLILSVALSACNQDKKESLGQPQEMSLELEERFKDAERSLSDLSKLNLNCNLYRLCAKSKLPEPVSLHI